MNLIIVDDELPVREAITHMVALYYPKAHITGAFGNISEAAEAIRSNAPDVLLLDVEVGRERGFDLLKYFPKPSFKVIFITAYQQYALDAFRFSALDFLLKPLDPDLLASALDKASDLIGREHVAERIDALLHNMADTDKRSKRIVLKTVSDIHVVNVPDIMYCEADHSYTTFYLADQSRIIVSTTLGDYEELLAGYGFVRIHQSYLLNMDYLSRYEKGEGGNVVLKDATVLPIARRKKEQFLEQLSKL